MVDKAASTSEDVFCIVDVILLDIHTAVQTMQRPLEWEYGEQWAIQLG